MTLPDIALHAINVRMRQNYIQAATEPLAWVLAADQLLDGARLLYKAFMDAAFSDDDPTIPPPGSISLSSCHLLYGFALENLFKALAAKKGLITVGVDKKGRDAVQIPQGMKAHKLLSMAKTVDFALEPGEEEVLDAMGDILNSVARYPIANNAEVHMVKRRSDGSIGDNLGLRSNHAKAMETIAQRILKELGVS